MKNKSSKFILILLCFVCILFISIPNTLKSEEQSNSNFKSLPGMLAFNFGDFPNAVSFFATERKSYKIGSDNWNLCSLQFALALLRNGENAKAKEVFSELQKTSPNFSKGSFAGELLMSDGKYLEAEKFFTNKLTQKLTSIKRAEYLFFRASCRVMTQNIQGAIKDYTQIESIKDLQLNIRNAALLRKIYLLMVSGDINEAKKILENPVFITENPIGYQYIKLFLALKNKDRNDFFTTWERTINTSEKRPNVWLFEIARLGFEFALDINEVDLAIKTLREAFAFAPNDDYRQMILLEISKYLSGINPSQSATMLLVLLEQYPNLSAKPKILLRAASLFYNAQDNEAALKIYKEISSNEKYDINLRIEAMLNSAKIYEKLNSKAQAISVLLEACNLADNNKLIYKCNVHYANFYFNMKEYQNCLKHLLIANKAIPNKTEVQYKKLLSYIELKDYNKALVISDKLLSLKDNKYKSEVQYFNAWVNEKLNNYKAARESYKRFIEENPNSKELEKAKFSQAMIEFKLQNFKEASNLFKLFSDNHTYSKLQEQSLFYSILSEEFSGGKNTQILLDKLDKEHKDSIYRIESRIQLAEYLRSKDKNDYAFNIINQVDPIFAQQNNMQYDVLYSKALILNQQKKQNEALTLIKAILSSATNKLCVVDAGFLAGNIASDMGDFAEAIKYYSRVAKLRPISPFIEICQGRIADCYFGLYGKTLDEKDLNSAIEIYKELSNKHNYISISLISYYKLGKCYELLNKQQLALDAYINGIYLALSLRHKGEYFDPFWVERSIYEALKIMLKDKSPQGNAKSLKLFELFQKMELPISNDMEKLYNKLKERQKL